MGLRRHCTRYKKVASKQSKTGFALRCADLTKNNRWGPMHPSCDPRLVGGGRSRGLIRPAICLRHKKRA